MMNQVYHEIEFLMERKHEQTKFTAVVGFASDAKEIFFPLTTGPGTRPMGQVNV